MTKTAITALACAALLAVGCSHGPSNPSASSGGQFWADSANLSGLEAHRPTSLKDLAKASDLVVVGTISAVKEGRDYSEAGKAPNRTKDISIKVERSAPLTADVVVFEVGSATVEAAAVPPAGRFVFFLQDAYSTAKGPVYGCTSPALCVFGLSQPVTSVRDPQAGRELESTLPSTVDDAFNQAAEALQP
jgi:hypothetical protein